MPDPNGAPTINYPDFFDISQSWLYGADTTVYAPFDFDGDGVFDQVIGVPDADAPGATNRGHVYLITLKTFGEEPGSINLSVADPPRDGGNPVFQDYSITRFTFPAGFRGGTDVAGGDVNGDGRIDLIIAARGGNNDAGSTYVYLNSGNPLPAEIALNNPDGVNFFRLDGSFAFGASSGMSVASGDLNNDGFDDVVVGTLGAASSAGAVQIYYGHAGPFAPVINLGSLTAAQGATLAGNASGDGLGGTVAIADFNGDGIDDLLATAELADTINGANSGLVAIVYGGANFDAAIPATPAGLNGTNGLTAIGPSANANFGWSADTAHDVNGDRRDDIIVGAPPLNNFSGGAYLLFGSATRTAATINTATAGPADVVFFNGTGTQNSGGVGVAGSDINGDGFADVIVGSPDVDGPAGLNVGAAYVYFGHGGPFPSVVQLNALNGANGFTIEGGVANARLGIDISGLFDTSGDLIPEFGISSSGNDTAFVFRGFAPTGAVTRIGSEADQTIVGSLLADILEGRGGNDILDGRGGGDTVRGEDGDDIALITDSDRFVGGTGVDIALLFASQVNGGVATMTPDTSETEIWDLSAVYRPSFIPRLPIGIESYNLVVDQAVMDLDSGISVLSVIAAELPLDVDALLDGAAVTNGSLRFFPGGGVMDVRGGAGNDGALWGDFGRFAPGSSFNGGPGADSIAFRGAYSGANALHFGSNSFPNVEVMVFLSGLTNQFGGDIVPGGFDYEATLIDVPGDGLDIVTALGFSESADVDASAVQTGPLRFFGGAGDDSYIGGAQFDLWYGAGGADFGDIGAGPGTFVFRSVFDSVTGAVDKINVRAGNTIDLSFIDAILSTPANDAFTIIGGNAFSSAVGGELRFFNTSGNLWRVEVNVDSTLVPEMIFDVETFGTDLAGVFVG